MALELQCQKCEDSFSLDVSDLSADPEIRCPGCGARAPEEQVETLAAALEDALAALSALRRKFSATIELDSEDLPGAEDAMAARSRRAALLDEDEDEDEDEDDEEAELDEA